MLQVKEIERESRISHGSFYSSVGAVRVYCPDCEKLAIIVKLPPQGKDLTVVCKDCLGSVTVDYRQLTNFKIPVALCCYNGFTYEFLCNQ